MITNGRDLLIYLSCINNGDWIQIFQDIENRRSDFSSDDVENCLKKLKCKALTILDEEYPLALKNIAKPPFVLFYHGDISLIKDCSKNIGVVGSRSFSNYGEQHCSNIINELPNDFNIVSGMAIGIDTIGMEAAINSGKKVISVLGSGINHPYPKSNSLLYDRLKNKHLIISEYPDNCLPKPDNFPIRNRIIAALSNVLFIPEAKMPSGTATTASYAASFGKTIVCLPHPVSKDNLCNILIKDGACLVQSADDIVFEMKK